ncbi:MAG: hypothetical protein R3C68_09200 [Myxococcota bacterium]
MRALRLISSAPRLVCPRFAEAATFRQEMVHIDRRRAFAGGLRDIFHPVKAWSGRLAGFDTAAALG